MGLGAFGTGDGGRAGDVFEAAFMARSVVEQVAHCDEYELAPLMRSLLCRHQPVLEAGCGAGRWVAWLANLGVEVTGIDWSETLCSRIREQVPGSRAVAGDLRSLPFSDGQFGSVLALGSMEHVPEGPAGALFEAYRVLEQSGVAIVTVPYGGGLRRFIRALRRPTDALHVLRSSSVLRRVLHKPSQSITTLRDARAATTRRWHPRYLCGAQGWSFFEYEFSRSDMRAFIRESGFHVAREFTAFADEGLFHIFGRLAGKWDEDAERVRLSPTGRLLKVILPRSAIGHMLCYILTKS